MTDYSDPTYKDPTLGELALETAPLLRVAGLSTELEDISEVNTDSFGWNALCWWVFGPRERR